MYIFIENEDHKHPEDSDSIVEKDTTTILGVEKKTVVIWFFVDGVALMANKSKTV